MFLKKVLKFIPAVLLLIILVLVAGCDDKNLIKKNMSDMRINYFTGECDAFFVDLSCGYREKEFAYDGVCSENVECGVLGLVFKTTYSYSKIVVCLDVDGTLTEVTLERSPFENKYLADLEKIYNDQIIKVSLKNSGEIVSLKRSSDEFSVSYDKALNIGANHFAKEFEDLYFNGKLNCECYLKIINKKDFDKTYWYFSYIDRAQQSKAILIDVLSGEVLAEKD